MNIIPIMPESALPSYTIIGTDVPTAKGDSGIGVILLNRGNNYYQHQTIASLRQAGFFSILLVSTTEGLSSIAQELVRLYPGIRLLQLPSKVNTGQLINIAMREIEDDYVLLLWSDMKLDIQNISSRFIDRLHERNILCLGSTLSNADGQELAIATQPCRIHKKVELIQIVPKNEITSSLCAYDFTGIYSRQRFLHIEGFDVTIQNEYWQNIEFGLRAHLWGEEICISQALKVSYNVPPPLEDRSSSLDYWHFWLRNIATVIRSGSAILPAYKFLHFLFASKIFFPSALRIFRQASKWVGSNRYRFKYDITNLVDNWKDF